MAQIFGFIAQPWAMALEVGALTYLAVPGNLPGGVTVGGDYAPYVHPLIAAGVYYFYNQMVHSLAGTK